MPPIISPAPAPPQTPAPTPTPAQNVVHGNVNVINQASWGGQGMDVDNSGFNVHAHLGGGNEPGCTSYIGLGAPGSRTPIENGVGYPISSCNGLGAAGGVPVGFSSGISGGSTGGTRNMFGSGMGISLGISCNGGNGNGHGPTMCVNSGNSGIAANVNGYGFGAGGPNEHSSLCCHGFCVCKYVKADIEEIPPREILAKTHKYVVKVWYGNNLPMKMLESPEWNKLYTYLLIYFGKVGMAAKLPSSYRLTHGIWICELNQMWQLVRSVCIVIFIFCIF